MTTATKSTHVVEGKGSNKSGFSLDFYTRLAHRLSCLWDARDNGDCKIKIQFTNAKAEATKKRTRSKALLDEEQPADYTLKCHSAVLSSGSEYFFKRLQSDSSNSSSNGSGGSVDVQDNLQYADGKEGFLTILVEHVNEEDVASFERMVKFFYMAEMDESLSVAELLRMLQVADRFAAANCYEAIRLTLLERISKGATDMDLTNILDFEPINREGLDSVEAAAQNRLILTFGKTYEIMVDESLLERWCNLSWKAVRWLLTYKELVVDCEETLACLLIHWLSSSTDLNNLTDSDKEIISDIESNLLRYGMLDLAFFSVLVASCPWLVQAQCYVHEVYRFTSIVELNFGSLYDKEFVRKTFKSPPNWYEGRLILANVNCQLSLELEYMNFAEAIKKYPDFPRTTKKMYGSGWNISLSVQPSADQRLCAWVSFTPACPIDANQVVPTHGCLSLNYMGMCADYFEPGKGLGFALSKSSNWGDISTWPEEDYFEKGFMKLQVVNLAAC